MLIPAAPRQQTSPSVPVSAEASLSVCLASSQWGCRPILNSVPIYMYTKNIISSASLVNSYTEKKFLFLAHIHNTSVGYTKIMPTYTVYFTCDLALMDGACGERIDEISVCGAPGLRIQQMIIYFSSKIYLLISVLCELHDIVYAYPVVPR